MGRRTFIAAGVTICLLAAAIRLGNAFSFPVLRGYDAFAHFGYIWFLAETGRVPDPTAGWEFFQPPGYYAYMLLFWERLSDIDPLTRLRLGTASIALLGLIPAYVSFQFVRTSFPGNRLVQLLAPGLILFLPVHLYSAGFLGNEGLCAVLCSLALLALMRTLQRETLLRCTLLGLVLGAAMLIKFTALVVVAAAFATLGLRALWQRRIVAGIRSLSVVAAAMLLVCGWFYGRNLVEYGNPFQMSREQLFLSHLEKSQLQGRRTLLEYVLFDPLILYRPQWPRGLSLSSPRPTDSHYSAMRESVPTGLYANTWFDGYGGFVLPRVTESETARRAGQLLLTLGVIPTSLMLLGVLAGLRRLRREGWDDTVVAMLFSSAAMAAVVIQGTRSVPTHAAVKATYLMPISVVFSYWFALGVHSLGNRNPRWVLPVAGSCAALGLLSAVVFTPGVAIDNQWMLEDANGPAFKNLRGVIYEAAGQREKARELFDSAAGDQWPFGFENLSALAFEEGRPLEALYRLRLASSLQSRSLPYTSGDSRSYLLATLAEYENSRSVFLERLGWSQEALSAARRSRRLYAKVPETYYNIGLLTLKDAVALEPGPLRSSFVQRAVGSFGAAAELDPAFREAATMKGVALTFDGDCTTGAEIIRSSFQSSNVEYRAYPMETGPGDQNSPGLHRRRRMEEIPNDLDPEARLRACERLRD